MNCNAQINPTMINKTSVKEFDLNRYLGMWYEIGELKTAKGKAKTTGIPGKLKVSFFLFFYAEYNVLELDSLNYQWALIGSSTPDYLWILSRTPHIDQTLYNELTEKAKVRGYEISKLLLVPQR